MNYKSSTYTSRPYKKHTHTAWPIIHREWIPGHNRDGGETNSKNINTGMYQGGVAILAHEELQRGIKQIERIGHQILKIILTNKKAAMPTAILATYAPHTGYKVEEKTTLGPSARNNKTNTYDNPMCTVCRCKWAIRGQETRRPEAKRDNWHGHYRKNNRTGKWHKAARNMHTTWPNSDDHMEKATQTKREPVDISTWIRPFGEIKRHIDYITVRQKYRNRVKRAYFLKEFKGAQNNNANAHQ